MTEVSLQSSLGALRCHAQKQCSVLDGWAIAGYRPAQPCLQKEDGSENDIRVSAESPWMREKSIWPNRDLAMALVGWGQCGRTSTDYTLLVQKHPVMTPVNLHQQNEGF